MTMVAIGVGPVDRRALPIFRHSSTAKRKIYTEESDSSQAANAGHSRVDTRVDRGSQGALSDSSIALGMFFAINNEATLVFAVRPATAHSSAEGSTSGAAVGAFVIDITRLPVDVHSRVATHHNTALAPTYAI